MGVYAEEEIALVFVEELGQQVYDLMGTLEAIPGTPPAAIVAMQAQQAYLVKMKAALDAVLPNNRRAAIKAWVVAQIAAG